MKLNEVIELNGKEYTVELNRDSVVKIDQYINMNNAMEIINNPIYEDKSEVEISDDENPFGDIKTDTEIIEMEKKRAETLKKVYTRAFWIWLYPVEKMPLKKVEEILVEYLEDEDKAIYISQKYTEFTKKSLELREKYIEELKNQKALAN